MGMLEGKVALVTGAASGIGQASAHAMAREGAKVVVVDIDEAGAGNTVEKIKSTGSEATFITCNVASAKDVENMVAYAVDTYGKLDCAFNNAGIEGVGAPTSEYDEEEWDKVLSINLKGIWLCMKYEIRAILQTGKGAIVNTSSALGKVGIANQPAYVASKHGVIGITRAAAVDYAAQGIRINAIAPGVVDTPLITRKIIEMPEIEAPLLAAHPIGRLGNPQEIAEAAIWLNSDRASFVTGEVLSVDGGYLAV